jgi:hypothetical protein
VMFTAMQYYKNKVIFLASKLLKNHLYKHSHIHICILLLIRSSLGILCVVVYSASSVNTFQIFYNDVTHWHHFFARENMSWRQSDLHFVTNSSSLYNNVGTRGRDVAPIFLLSIDPSRACQTERNIKIRKLHISFLFSLRVLSLKKIKVYVIVVLLYFYIKVFC